MSDQGLSIFDNEPEDSETSSDDEATRQMLNEMRRRIAEIRDGTNGNR